MWGKTATGLFLGLLVTVSLLLNLFYLLPWAQDTKLLTGLLFGFVAWGSIMSWCYSLKTAWQSLRVLFPLLALSALLNFWMMS